MPAVHRLQLFMQPEQVGDAVVRANIVHAAGSKMRVSSTKEARALPPREVEVPSHNYIGQFGDGLYSYACTLHVFTRNSALAAHMTVHTPVHMPARTPTHTPVHTPVQMSLSVLMLN